jgi:hypothetical protein
MNSEAAGTDRPTGIHALVARVRDWTALPGNSRRALRWAVVGLIVAGLLLPPVSLLTRIRTWDYTALRPGQDVVVGSGDGPAVFALGGRAISRASRLRLRRDNGAAGRLPDLPAGHTRLSDVYRLDVVGPAPRAGALELAVAVTAGDHPFVDGYGWDGQRWRWLAPEFYGADRLRLAVPLASWVPEYIVAALATEAATQVSAVVPPPPASLPAAMAEVPVLEMRAYHLTSDDGRVTGERFALPSRKAAVFGVVDNLEDTRVRSDLVNNLLIPAEARQLHRKELVNLVRRDQLDGLVLDYRGIDVDLQPVYAGFLGRLAQDLHRVGAELVVAVPMPHAVARGWDASPYNWRELSAGADYLRVNLPSDQPLETEAMDGLVRWALGQVERNKLQLGVPALGRDVMAEVVTPIAYSEALGRMLDLASADAPGRVDPGTTATVDLPTVRQAGLARDPATGMWRFNYWDANRREHTVWLHDAAGLRPAFDIAARYRLGQIAVEGASASMDPAVWRMVTGFLANRKAEAPDTSYRLRWELLDAADQVIQQAVQPLEEARFAFRAPDDEGSYRLRVSLVGPNDRVAAIGGIANLLVAPPPPATPVPDVSVIVQEPTEPAVVTAAPPRDEVVAATRAPVRVGESAAPKAADFNAVVSFAEGPLRDKPDFTGKVVTDLRVGDLLQVVGATADGGWYQAVHSATGVEGWVRKELVSLKVPLGDIQRGLIGAVPGTPQVAPPPAATQPIGSSSGRSR